MEKTSVGVADVPDTTLYWDTIGNFTVDSLKVSCQLGLGCSCHNAQTSNSCLLIYFPCLFMVVFISLYHFLPSTRCLWLQMNNSGIYRSVSSLKAQFPDCPKTCCCDSSRRTAQQEQLLFNREQLLQEPDYGQNLFRQHLEAQKSSSLNICVVLDLCLMLYQLGMTSLSRC